MSTSTSNSIEERATSPTGGEKGRKPQVFSLIPWESVTEISKVYHYGAKKYSEHNWRRGYPWSWSFDAMIRHLTAWWSGEDKDPESGISHLTHAGFHVLSLLWYELTGRGTDDRWKPPTDADNQKLKVSNASLGGYPQAMDGDGSLAYSSLGYKGLVLRKATSGELSDSYTLDRHWDGSLPRRE
jgi:hypothetical protein